jgi:oligosaccharide repeat unit polymerase
MDSSLSIGLQDQSPGAQKASRWSSWLWLMVILATFLVAWFNAGLSVALGSSAAMFVSALLQQVVGSPFRARRVTINSFWFLTYLVMIFFPAFFIYADEQNLARGRFLFAVTSVLVTVPLGFVLASWFCKFRKSETESFFLKPLEANVNPAGVMPIFSAFLAISMVLAAWYMRQVGTVPLFHMIRNPGDYYTLMFLREDSFKLLNSSLNYAFALLRGLLFPFIIAVSFGYFLWTRHKQWLIGFVAAAVTGIFFASLSLAKSPVAIIFLVVVLFAYYYKHGMFSYKFVLISLAVIFAFPLLVMIGVAENSPTASILLQSLFERLIYGTSLDVYWYFEAFPAHIPYLHGASSHALSIFAGVPVANTPNMVGQYSEPFGLASINANAAFIGDLHADFGLAGVLIGGVITGIVMQAFHIYIVRKKKTVSSVAAYSFLVYAFWQLNSTSLPPVLASGGALPVLVLLWIMDGKPWPNWFSRAAPNRLATGEIR